MTNNIEKLYELAKVKKVGKKLSCSLLDFGACKNIKNCSFCDKAKLKEYQPFTDTKQLELESYIFQLNYGFCSINRQLDATFENGKFQNHFFVWEYRIGDIGYIDEETGTPFDDFEVITHNIDRKQALTGLVCELWKNLTDEQREEVRGILQ